MAKRYGITSYGTIVLESGAKEEKVLVADEENLTNALLKVIREGKKVTYDLKADRDDPTAVGTRAMADARCSRISFSEISAS